MKLKPADYVNEFGGKLGGLFYLGDYGGFEKNLLPIVAYVGKDQHFSDIEGDFSYDFKKDLIVRPSHPNDYWGFVDTLMTRKSVRNKDELAVVIDDIKEKSSNQLVYEYSKYEGQEYDGKVRIFAQPEMKDVRGSMIEHPHKRGTYIVDFVSDTNFDFTQMDQITLNDDGVVSDKHKTVYIHYAECEPLMKRLVDLYKNAGKTGFIPKGFSFQMEFTFPDKGGYLSDFDVYCLQIRPFIKFKEPTFEMRKKYGAVRCFGITSPKGVNLPVIDTCQSYHVNDAEAPFALMMTNITYRQGPDFMPRMMKAFLPVGNRANQLEHQTYKWIPKADVSVLDPNLRLENGSLNDIETGEMLNIKCNGLSYELRKVS